MSHYHKHVARRNSARCGMCKYYKKIGNGKEHLPMRDRRRLVWRGAIRA